MSSGLKIDSKKIMKEIKKQIEKKPVILLKQNAGKTIDAVCPNCGSKGILINSNGDGECLSCKARIKIELNIT